MFSGRRKWLAVAVVLIAIAAAYPLWLPLPGVLLVNTQAPEKSDGLIVLAGEYSGYRAQAGAELVREGYAPVALISGTNWYYGIWESDLAIDFAVRNGQPREILESFRHEATSTDEELQLLFAEAQRRGWRRVILVTSNFHTRRTGLLVRRNLPAGLDVRIFGSPDKYFQPEQWWWHRESRKILFLEWVKLVAAVAGGL